MPISIFPQRAVEIPAVDFTEVTDQLALINDDIESKFLALTDTVNNMSIPIVKSVQQGTSSGWGSRTIIISEINVNKSLLLLHHDTASTTSYQMSARGKIETSTSISIGTRGGITTVVDWQVIEFY